MRNLNEGKRRSNEIEMRRRLFRYFSLESERILIPISEADNTRLWSTDDRWTRARRKRLLLTLATYQPNARGTRGRARARCRFYRPDFRLSSSRFLLPVAASLCIPLESQPWQRLVTASIVFRELHLTNRSPTWPRGEHEENKIVRSPRAPIRTAIFSTRSKPTPSRVSDSIRLTSIRPII